MKALASRPELTFIFDLSRLSFLSSVGIAALMSLQKSLDARGGGLRLAGITAPILGALRRCKLDRQFHTFDSVEAALKS
jgi:anti-anti-sigma factor